MTARFLGAKVVLAIALLAMALSAVVLLADEGAIVRPMPAPHLRPATTQVSGQFTTTAPGTTQPWKKDIVLMDELVDLYEPVPFDHKGHAQMSEMWDGCTTCHHRPPAPNTPATTQAGHDVEHDAPNQDNSDVIPACKSCHPVKAVANEAKDLRVPSLKGAYHRQCLNCHREWMDANACVACHAAKKDKTAASTLPTTMKMAVDDIVGRMHKPIAAKPVIEFKARFTPEAGPNVRFDHEEHTKTFGLRCSTCHRRDSCADCHSSSAVLEVNENKPHPLKPGRTWKETHGPCLTCHQQEKCNRCHFQDGEAPPPKFDHRTTGQTLDKDHAGLTCARCHSKLKVQIKPTCGDASCHSKHPIAFPIDRPGDWKPTTTQPTTQATTQATTRPTTRASTQPATRPTVIRIRRSMP